MAAMVLSVSSGIGARAQVVGGVPHYASTSGGPDQVNLSNLNVVLNVPFLHRTGRGIDLSMGLTYNSAFYSPVDDGPIIGKSWAPPYTGMGWTISGGQNSSNYVYATYAPVVSNPVPTMASVTTQTTGTLPSGTYYVQYAWRDAANNRTPGSKEATIQLTSAGGLSVAIPPIDSYGPGTYMYSASGGESTPVAIDVFIGTSSGRETLQGSADVGGYVQSGGTYNQQSALTTDGFIPEMMYGGNTWSDFAYIDPAGHSHPFFGTATWVNDFKGLTKVLAADGSGLSLTFAQSPSNSNNVVASITFPPSAANPNGKTIVPYFASFAGAQPSPFAYSSDSNGNYIGYSGSNYTWQLLSGGWSAYVPSGTLTDTLGNAVPVITLGENSTFTYPTSTGSANVTQAYTSFTVQTAFGCSDVLEYTGGEVIAGVYNGSDHGPGSSGSPLSLLTSITLPDGRSYTYTYEPSGTSGAVTGRIQTITLPSGGSVTYVYSTVNGLSIDCNTGSPLGFTRTVNDGQGNKTVWTYSRTGGLSPVTTVTDPTGAKSVHTFKTIEPTILFGTEFAETSTLNYASDGTLLQTVNHCYSQLDCSSAGTHTPVIYYPLTSVTTTTALPDASGVTSQSIQTLDGLGQSTESDSYDFGAPGKGVGKLLSKTATSYADVFPWYGRPALTTTYASDGSSILSETKMAYDETAPIQTNGVPNHYTGTNLGNMTTLQKLISGTSNWLTSTFVYNDTGTLASTTDPNRLLKAIYSYDQCGNSFLSGTSISLSRASAPPLTLTSSQLWDCIAETVTSSTDVNGNTSTMVYADPYNRVTSMTDALGNSVVSSYPTVASNSSQTTTTFNGGSTTLQNVTFYDGLGRTILQQKQGTSGKSYDSSSVAYNSLGQVQWSSLPYSGAYGLGSYLTSGYGVTTLYDGLGRQHLVSDSGGGYTQYDYTGNDVLLTSGPAPKGESLKKKVLEYDAASTLTSVCEVTGLPGSGACGQLTNMTGYLTRYVHTGTQFQVLQNAQAGAGATQVRTVNYDLLGRTLSETIPETGTGTFRYDTDPSGACPGSSAGDLIARTDNAGNTTCLSYDTLHRVLTSKVISGPQAAVTDDTYYVYDLGAFGGTNLQNVRGSLAEAYTCANGSNCSTRLTDYFNTIYAESGSQGRMVKQVWESTPHSGGFFTSQSAYYANGTPGTLSASLVNSSGSTVAGISGNGLYPTMSYGLDGEGRPYAAKDTTNCLGLVLSVAYDASSKANTVNFGNGDTDTYTPDPSTGRVTNFIHTITGNTPFTSSGALTWNADGSLQQFIWTDGNDASQNQTCQYGSDDLHRVGSVDCGTAWAQTFAYDAFGNINKSGNGGISYGASYVPSYAQASMTNQVVSGATASYDGNGNQTTTNFVPSITWNALSNPVSSSSGTMTYDALGRLVEFGGTQVMYGPGGEKLGTYSNGDAETTVALPGGEEASYSYGYLVSIRHKDWLGSSRLATTWAHSVMTKTAYAPFGENYAQSGTSDLNFTGQKQDSVASLYDFPARKYDPNAGRWLSPDPSGWSAVDPTDPQTLNRYAYVRNIALNATDPNGLECYAENGTTGDGTCDDDEETEEANANYDAGQLPHIDESIEVHADVSQYDASTDGDLGLSAGGFLSLGTSNYLNAFFKSGAPNCHTLAAGEVPSGGASIWAAGYANASRMLDQWIAGTGPTDRLFSSGSPESQQMMGAYGLANNISSFLSGGPSSGFQNFGVKGLFGSGLNPTAQFVGSYGWSMSLNGGNLNITINNATTMFSAFYHAPGLNRNPPTVGGSVLSPGTRLPMGRVNQTFKIQVPCP